MPVNHPADGEGFQAWLLSHFKADPDQAVPLFELNGNFATLDGRGVLKRSARMTAHYSPLLEEIRDGAQFCGLLYLMYWLRDARIVPLYIGIAQRLGRKGKVSTNITTSPGFFGRWGSSSDYHMGDLTAALNVAGGGVKGDWADKLFLNRQTRELRRATYFGAIKWTHSDLCPSGKPMDVVALEACLIRHGRAFYPADNLNDKSGGGKCRCPR